VFANLATNIPEASKCLRTDAQLFVAKQRSKGLESFVISTIHVIQFTTLSVTHLLTHCVLKFLLKDMTAISPWILQLHSALFQNFHISWHLLKPELNPNLRNSICSRNTLWISKSWYIRKTPLLLSTLQFHKIYTGHYIKTDVSIQDLQVICIRICASQKTNIQGPYLALGHGLLAPRTD